MKVTASSPGKIILTGEHFVVHGAYSIAAAINKRVFVSITDVQKESFIVSGSSESKVGADDGRFPLVKAIVREAFGDNASKHSRFEIRISSEIPSGSGLGSSAAVSVATAAAALKFSRSNIDQKKVLDLASLGEKQVHGNPSGIDVETSLNGGLLLFSRKTGSKSIPLNRIVHFLIVYSGKPRRTSSLISKVEQRKKEFPNFFDSLTRAASFLSLDVVDALTAGDLPRLGALMNISQATLSWIGVSTPVLDQLIEDIASRDVFGVKLTGAGGGGSIIALPKPETMRALLKFTSKNYATSFVSSIPQDGLRWES